MRPEMVEIRLCARDRATLKLAWAASALAGAGSRSALAIVRRRSAASLPVPHADRWRGYTR